MKDLYNLTREQNVFLAKKLIKESIYFGAKLEGSNITFPQTETILNGVNVAEVGLDDIQTVLNLRNAWKFLLADIDTPITLDNACKINFYVAYNEALEWGKLRTGNVCISGTDYVPPLPSSEADSEKIDEIISHNCSVTERAIKLFLWMTRSQLFWEGNKRTSLLMANKLLIQNGKGLLSTSENNLLGFSQMLSEFYTTGDYGKAMDFIYNNCIQGISFQQEKTSELEP